MPYLLWFRDSEYERQNPLIRCLMWLAHYWHEIWIDHEDFWRIPTEHSETMSVYTGHTSYFREWTWLYPVILQDNNGVVFPADYRVELDSDTVPDTFAKLGMHSWGDMDIGLDVAHYETIFVLGWNIYQYLRPSAKWLVGFIKKHKEFLLDSPTLPWSNLKHWEEWAWQWAKKILELVVKNQTTQQQEAKKPKQKKKKTVSATPDQNKILTSSRLAKPNVAEEIRFAAPRILDAFVVKMREGQATWEIRIRDICDDIPVGAKLCIGEYISGGLRWHTHGYTIDETVPFDPINPGKSKEFVFCLAHEDQSPNLRLEHKKVTVTRPKERKVSTTSDTWWNNNNQDKKVGNPPVKNTHAQPNNNSDNDKPEKEVSIEVDPTDEFVLSLIDPIDALGIQRVPSWLLVLTLPGRDDFELRYDMNSLTFSVKKSPEWVNKDMVLSVLLDDLKPKVDNFLFIDAQNKKTETLSQLHFAYAFLRANLASIGDISKLDLEKKDSFLMTRMKDDSGAIYLLSNGYRQFLDRFKATCLQEYGTYLDVAQIEKTQEVRIALSIKWSDGISGSITSTNKEPYYELSDLTGLDNEIANEITKILKGVLFFLSSAGRALKFDIKVSTQWGYTMDSNWLKTIFTRSFRTENDPEQGEDITKSDAERARDLYNKIQKSDWVIKICSDVKICTVNVPWTNTKEQVQIYTISSLKNWKAKEFLKDAPDDTMVLYIDERLAFMGNGSGHANIYNRIRISERLQKYLTVRMVQIIEPAIIRDAIVDPIPETWGKHIREAWQAIDERTQQEFLSCFTTEEKDGKVTRALDIKDSGGKRVFDTLLEALEENGVKIIHHSPGWIILGKIREHAQSIKQI